ncbi:MAG: leucyl aminopeptidase family protein, partial [Candidatus Altimarinota bacterium]
MKITYKRKVDVKDQLILLPLTEELNNFPAPLQNILKNPQLKKRFLGKKGQKAEVFFADKKFSARILLWGLGKKPDLNSTLIRGQFALAIKDLRSSELGDLTVIVDPALKPYLQAMGEGIGLGNFHSAKYKTGQDLADSEKKIVSKLNLVAPTWLGADKVYIADGYKIASAVNFVRELVNAPSNIVNVDKMAEYAVDIAKQNKYKITVLDKKQLEKHKMGALLAVNRGSEHHAKMVIMEYLPLGKKQEPVALIGKGVVFDTGGVNIKPTMGLDWMKMDMAGAAVVLGVFSLLKELDIQQNVVGIFPLTDNAVDATSLKPSDIITSYSGKTIEIGNTDAEGRLILADAISYAVKNYSPSSIVDLATLTGACMVALGDH